MAARQPVEQQQRYRDIRKGIRKGFFGMSGIEWIVEDAFLGTDRVRYARLVCASDLTLKKILAEDLLGDRRCFQRM